MPATATNNESRIDRLSLRYREFRNWTRLAREQTGKGAAQQLREIHALRRGGGQCGVSDYYWYKLYDEHYLMDGGAADFMGWRLQQKFSLALNPRSAVLPAWDKFVFTQLAHAAGLPVAPIRAAYHAAGRIAPCMGEHLRNPASVARFLRDPANYPLFGKPAYSQQGVGSISLPGYDAASDTLHLIGGKTIPLESFLRRLETAVDYRYHKPACGFVFQETFAPAPEIRAITEWSAICGVRVVCLNGPDGVMPIRAIWKIAVPPNQVDNFSLGKYGNLLADVDLTTGEISRVISGLWPNTKLLSEHPVSGKSFADFHLPGWDKVLDACQRAGAVFPLMKIHHWDFALTDRGPMMLELNDLGGTEIAQLHGHGLLKKRTRDFLKRHADKTAHPWIKRL